MQTKCVPYLHMLCSDPSKYAPDESWLFWSRKTRIIPIRVPCRNKDDAASGISGLYLWCSHFWKSPVLWCVIQKGKQGFLDWNLTVVGGIIIWWCIQIELHLKQNKTKTGALVADVLWRSFIDFIFAKSILAQLINHTCLIWENWTKQVHIVAEVIKRVYYFLAKMTFFRKIGTSKSYFLLTNLACQFIKINLLCLITEPYYKRKQRMIIVFSCSTEHFMFLRYKVLSSQRRYA